MTENINQVIIGGVVKKVYPVRRTPYGLSVVSFVLEHESNLEQTEASELRAVKCRLYCVAIDVRGLTPDSLIDKMVEISGFLSQNFKSQIVLYVKQIKFLDKGN